MNPQRFVSRCGDLQGEGLQLIARFFARAVLVVREGGGIKGLTDGVDRQSWYERMNEGDEKNYQWLSRCLARCLHLDIISFLLLRELAGSARQIRVFSVRQSWQTFDSLEYDGASLWIFQDTVCGIPDDFRSQM